MSVHVIKHPNSNTKSRPTVRMLQIAEIDLLSWSLYVQFRNDNVYKCRRKTLSFTVASVASLWSFTPPRAAQLSWVDNSKSLHWPSLQKTDILCSPCRTWSVWFQSCIFSAPMGICDSMRRLFYTYPWRFKHRWHLLLVSNRNLITHSNDRCFTADGIKITTNGFKPRPFNPLFILGVGGAAELREPDPLGPL